MKKFGCLGVLGVVALLAVILALTGVGKYNTLVSMEEGVDGQWAQVQNVYQRRADLIPNLVNTVKGAADFEKETLTQVIEARAKATSIEVNASEAPQTAAQLKAFQDAQSGLSSALSRLLVTVERYPELKANANFLDLQAQLEGTENRITVERMKFNDAVKGLNSEIRKFPTVIFAGMMGFEKRPYFEAESGAEEPPAVEFDFKGSE